MLPLLAMTALSMAGAASASSTANANAAAQSTINKANADAENILRPTRNELTQAKGRLARANQIESNRRTAQAGGRALEAAVSNANRAKDNAVKGSLEQQIGFAEQAGAAHAKQAFAGITGSVVDMVNGTTALRRARITQDVTDKVATMGFDAKNVALDIQRAMIENQDTSSIMDNLDYGFSVASSPQAKNGNFDILLAGASTFIAGGGMGMFGSAGKAGFTGSGIQQSNVGREGTSSFFRPSDNYGTL